MVTSIMVNNGSGNALLPDGTKLFIIVAVWFFICVVLWHSPDNNFTASAQDNILWNIFDDRTFEITVTTHRDHQIELHS